MPGGLLQLVAYGVQDFILTGDPQITFFKKAYRRNTLFSSEILKLKFSGDQEFNKTSTCKIPNNGDLLGKSVLQIDLPKISCYQIKENSNTINVDNTYQENQILKKIELLNKFVEKKLESESTHILAYVKNGSTKDHVNKIIHDFDNYLIKYNLKFTSDEIEYVLDNMNWTNLTNDLKSLTRGLLSDDKKLEEKNIGNIVYEKKYYNSLLNNFYFTLIKLSILDEPNLEYLRFLDNKLQTFYNKHILNSYDISTQINNRLKEKILINWYKNKIKEINSSSTSENLDENEYNLNITNNGVLTNHINDYNTIINDNIIPTKFITDLELSYSFGKEIYQNTINQKNKLSSLLEDSLKINYLVIKSLINMLYNPDAKLILFLKYSYNSNNTIDKVGSQSLIFSDETKWTKYYEKLFNLYDENNDKQLITNFNLPIKNLLETKFTQFRNELDNIMKSLTIINSDNANDFFKFAKFINLRVSEGEGLGRFNNKLEYGEYNFSNIADLNNLTNIHYNPSKIDAWVDTFSNNLFFIDFNSFLYLKIQNRDSDSINYINTDNTSYVESIHDKIYTYIHNQISPDITDLADIKSGSNDAFVFLCSVIDFNKLFTVENIIDNYVKNIASYKYTLNIDPNLIGQNEDSKHILKIKKTYTINSNWFTVNYQNNDTIIKIKDLFLNRSFYYDISDSYKLQINDTDYEIKIFKGNYPFEGTDLLELSIDGLITDIQTVKLISEKNNIIIFSSGNYYSSLYLSNNKLIIDRISDNLIKDSLIDDINIEISLDSNLLTAELITKEEDLIYNRDVISEYLNLIFNKSQIHLFDEKIYPLLKVKIIEIAKTYKYYQLVSINQKVLDIYKKFFDEFISELSETVGISSFNFYNLLSKKNEKLSMDRINKELNNTTNLVSKGNINGNTNPTNIIERDIKDTINPPLYEYELVEGDKIIVTHDSTTYNYNVTNITSKQITLDQKFNFDKNDVVISKETKFINYGGGYKIVNNTITGIVPTTNLINGSIASIINTANKDLTVNNTIPDHTKILNSIIQIVSKIKKTDVQIIAINTKSLTLSKNPNNIFSTNQKLFTKNKELIGVVNTIINNNEIYSINLKKDIDLTSISLLVNDYLYQGITSLRKVSTVTANKLTVDERYFNKSTNIKQISNIIPSENISGSVIPLYLNSVFRSLIGINLNITNFSSLLTDVTLGTKTTITSEAVLINTIPDYSFTLDTNDKVIIYGTNDVLKYVDSSLTVSSAYGVGTKILQLNQNIASNLVINSKIYAANKDFLGIVRSLTTNTITLDDTGLLKAVSSGDSIFKTQDINGIYHINKPSTGPLELKSENGLTDINTSSSDWTKDLDTDSGKIYKISNKNRLIKSVDKITPYNLKAWSSQSVTTGNADVNVYIDGKKPINTLIKVGTSAVSGTAGQDTTFNVSLDTGADMNSITINSNIYNSTGNFIGTVKDKDNTTTPKTITIAGVTGNTLSIPANTYLYVLNNIIKSPISTAAASGINNSASTINVNLDPSSLLNQYLYKKDNSLIGQVTAVTNTSPFSITLNKIGSALSQNEELFVLNMLKTAISPNATVAISASASNGIEINQSGATLINKYIYKDGNIQIGKVTASNLTTSNSITSFTIDLDKVLVSIGTDDKIWIADDDNDLLKIQLSSNPIITTNSGTQIGTISSSDNNKLTFQAGISVAISADQELYFLTDRIRINTEVNHDLNNTDQILIYNNSFDEIYLNNNKYKVFSPSNNTFNLIELFNIETNQIPLTTANIFNVYGTAIGICNSVSNNKLTFTAGIKISLTYGLELFYKNTSSKLVSLKLIILNYYEKGTTSNIEIGKMSNKATISLANIKSGKIHKIDSTNSLEKTANLFKTSDNLIKLRVTGNHNLNVGDMIIIYGINIPTPSSNTTYYSKIHKKKVIVSKIEDSSNFVINVDSESVTDTDNNINVSFYKIPFTEYNLPMTNAITTTSNITQLTLNCNHDLLNGDQILIYNSNITELNDLWIVKQVSNNKSKIELIYSQSYNFNINKVISTTLTTFSGILIKVGTSSITGVNFNKYIKYSDIIRIDNSNYDSTNTYLNKFPQIQYRSIKNITDTIIELDEPIYIPFRRFNIDLIKYEIPNFTLDLQINSSIRCKIGNVFESKTITEISNDHTLIVDSNFSNNVDFYIDLNQIVYENAAILSQIFNLNFKKLFLFNSKTFNGKEFFEKNATDTTISYNNWEKIRYYSTSTDVTNNPENYDIYNYSNKLIELNSLHWEYYKKNNKILKIKAFTPNAFNYTKSISELILLINKIIYDFNDKIYFTDIELELTSSNNYKTKYYIGDNTNMVQIEKNNNQFKLQTSRNLNEYNQETIRWNKKHQLKFTDFINQKFKLSDNYIKRFNKRNKIVKSEVLIKKYDDGNYDFNIIEGFNDIDSNKNIDIVEKINDNQYFIDNKSVKISKVDTNLTLHSDTIIDNTINKNIFLEGTTGIFLENKNRRVLNLINNKFNSKLIDKLYVSQEIKDTTLNYNLSFIRNYTLIITRVNEKDLYFKNLSNDLDLTQVIKSGDYIRFKLDENQYVRKVLRVVSKLQIELEESLLLNKYFVDETPVKVDKEDGYEINTSLNIFVDTVDATRYFSAADNVFDSFGNLIGVIASNNGFTTNSSTNVQTIKLNKNNLVKVEDNLNLHFTTLKLTDIEIFNYQKVDSIKPDIRKLNGLVSFSNTTVSGDNTKFISNVNIGDKIFYKGYDSEVDIDKIKKIKDKMYDIELDQVIDQNKSFILEEKDNTIYKVKSIEKYGINNYYLFLDTNITIDQNKKYSIYYTNSNSEQRFVTAIGSDTSLTLDKPIKIEKFIDKSVFELHKLNNSKEKSIGTNLGLGTDSLGQYFVYTNTGIRDNLAIGNMVKITLNVTLNGNAIDLIYQRFIKDFNLNNNFVYFDRNIEYSFLPATVKSVELVKYYSYMTNLNLDYPEDMSQLLECNIEITNASYEIKSANNSLFKNVLKIGDKILIKGGTNQYERIIVRIDNDTAKTNEILIVDKAIPENINKANILYKINSVKLETPNDYKLNKKSDSYLLSGLVEITNANRKKMIGTNTKFKSEVHIGDTITVNINQNYETGIVSKINSDTDLEIDHSFKFIGNNLYVNKYLILPPIELTGRSNVNNTNLLKGIKTNFISELKINDYILIEINRNKFVRRIVYIYNDNLIELDQEIPDYKTNVIIHKINKLSGYTLPIKDQVINNYRLNIKVVGTYTKSTSDVEVTISNNPTNILSYGDKIVNYYGVMIGFINDIIIDTNTNVYKIKFSSLLENLSNNTELYLPNMIKLSNSNIKVGSCLKINDDRMVNVVKNLKIDEKINTGLILNGNPTTVTATGITTIIFKAIDPKYFIKKGSILLDNTGLKIGTVINTNINAKTVEIIKEATYLTLANNQEIFIGNKTHYLFLEQPLLELSTSLVNTGTTGTITSIVVASLDTNIKVDTILYNQVGFVLGKVSAINSNTLTIANGSSIALGVGDNLYYNLDTKLINKIDMIDNSIVNSQISVTSNTDYITFSNSAIKPNLDVNDKVLINDNLLYKIKKVEKNKLTLNKQINLSTSTYSIKKISNSPISIIQEKDNKVFENKYFDSEFQEISKLTIVGNIIFNNILDTSDNTKYYYNSVYPLSNLFSGSTGFISSVDSSFDIMPLDRTIRFQNKTNNTTTVKTTNFKLVQLELASSHHLEEFFSYKKESINQEKLNEIKEFQINNINFNNADFTNNWTKIIDFKINTESELEEIKLNKNSRFSLNDSKNIIQNLSSINLKHDISNTKITDNTITNITGKVLTISGTNILNDYKIGTCIFKSNIYVGKVEAVTENTITLDSIGTLLANDKLEVSSIKSADSTNKLYSMRSDIFEYDFNSEYSYKLVTLNQDKNIINQYILSGLEKISNKNEIIFTSSKLITEIELKDSTLNSSSFINENSNFVFYTINCYQIELDNQTKDNRNNKLIQESEYLIKNISQEKNGINSEFTFTDTEIFNIVNPIYKDYLTLDEIFELIATEFKDYYSQKLLYQIFMKFIKLKDLILVSNLTYLKEQGEPNNVNNDDDDYLTSLANYTEYDTYNGIILKKEEKVIEIFDYLQTNLADKIINNDIQFISDKLNLVLTDLICQEKFIEAQYNKQDNIINSQIEYIQSVYSHSINNKYVFYHGTILKEDERDSIKDQKIIPNKLSYKEKLLVKNITILDKWVRIEIDKQLDNLDGVWTLLENDNTNNIYHNIKVIEKRDNLLLYLEMVDSFQIDTAKTYYLESSYSIEKLEKDWNKLNNFIVTFSNTINIKNKYLALEEFDNLTNYQTNLPNKVYYLKQLLIKEKLKFIVDINLDLNKKYKLVTYSKLTRKYLLPNQFKILDDKLKRRIHFDTTQEAKITSTNCKINNTNNYVLGSTSIILDSVTGLSDDTLLFNDLGSFIGKISNVNTTSKTITISGNGIFYPLKHNDTLYKESEYFDNFNLQETLKISNKIEKNKYTNHFDKISDIKKLIKFVNFENIIHYIRINEINKKIEHLIKNFIRIPSEKVGSDFLFNLNKYHIHNLINYFYYYFAENYKDFNYSEIFNVKNLVDYDTTNRYLLDLTKYNINFNKIKSIKLYAYLENSDFDTIDYSQIGFNITNYYQIYTNPYHVILSLDSSIIDLERDPTDLGTDSNQKYYILLTLTDNTEIKVVKNLSYIRDDNVKINYDIALNNYQLVTQDSNINLEYKYLQNTKQSDVEILNSNSINNLNCNLPDLVTKNNKINISHAHNQPIHKINIAGYIYKFYFIDNTDLELVDNYKLIYGSNEIKFLKNIPNTEFKIIEIISDIQFVYKSYYLLKENIYDIKKYENQIIDNTLYQNKLVINFGDKEIDVNYTNYYIIKIDNVYRKVDNISNDKEIFIEEDLTVTNKTADKLLITYLEDLLLIKDYNKTNTENISQITLNNTINITGLNTLFQTQLDVNDLIIINNIYVRQVKTIISQTNITVNEAIPLAGTFSICNKINYISLSVGNVNVTNKKVSSLTHNLGTYFYFPINYLKASNNKVPIKSIESSYIKLNGSIKKENYNNKLITGTNTIFTIDLKVGDKIRIKTRHNYFEYRTISKINSDTQIEVNYGINNVNNEETTIYKLQQLIGQIKISGDDFNIVEGVSTLFTKQLRIDDYIRVEVNGFDYIKKIKSIESDIQLSIDGTFNQVINTPINFFKETNGYILNLNNPYTEQNEILKILEEKRLFFESYPISEDYSGLVELEFNEKLNIDESHTTDFDFTLNSFNTKLVKSYPLIYHQIKSPKKYSFLVKKIELDSSLTWKLSYKNILSGYKVYQIDYPNLGNLNEYVYQIKVKIGLNFKDLKSDFTLSLGANQLTETNNTVELYNQNSKTELVLIKAVAETLPITGNYYLFVKNQFKFDKYQIENNIVKLNLTEKIIYYSDIDNYKHKYYIADSNDNQITLISDIVDIQNTDEYNYQLTLPANITLTDSEYKIIHLRQLEIESIQNYKKDRTLDIDFNQDVHFNNKVYGETASQFLSGTNEIDINKNSKIYKFDLLGDKLHATATYNIIKTTSDVNDFGEPLYYIDVVNGTNYTENDLNIGNNILFYNNLVEYNARVRLIEIKDTTNRRIYLDKINQEFTNVIIYKYSQVDMKLLNTGYTISYGNNDKFDLLNFYDGSSKRQLYFTSKTPIIRQTNILKLVDKSDSSKIYYRFVKKIENGNTIIEESIGKDINAQADIYYNKTDTINFIDQDYNFTINSQTVTLNKTPNSELKVNDIVIIENKFIRKVTLINNNILTLDYAVTNGTYYNISKVYLIEELIAENLSYVNSNNQITGLNSSKIYLNDELTIDSETDVTNNITIDPIDNYPIIRIDKDFDYLNSINTNYKLNEFQVNKLSFINHDIDGNYIKLEIQNKDQFTIQSNTIFKLYKRILVIPKYKEFNGTFPIDLSFYKSLSFRKHRFLINSINKRKISDNFLISFQDNIIEVNNKITKNLESYKEEILRNKKIIKPVTISQNNLELSFIKNIGHYMINYIQVFIGEQKIDKHTGEWLDLYNQLNTNNNSQYDKMIGNIPQLLKYDKTPKGNYRLFVPLSFWFCQKPGLALPLIAMHNNTVRIELKLNKLEDCIKYAKNSILKQEGKLKISLLSEFFYLEETERKLFAESKHEYLIERLQMTPSEIITDKFNNVRIDFVDPIKDLIWTIKSQKNIDSKDNTIYCDTEEIIKYDIYQKEYLDNLKTYNNLKSLETPDELIPNSFKDINTIFKNLVEITLENYIKEKYMKFYLNSNKEAINADWTYQASINTWTSTSNHNLIVNDVVMFNTNGDGATNYQDNQIYFVIKVGSTTTIQLSRKYSGTEFKGDDNSVGNWKLDKVNKGRIAQNNAYNIYKNNLKKNTKIINKYHLFEKGAIKIFNRKITADKDANYYNYLQTMNYKKTPDHGIYVHNFSLYPLEYQPSGSCNFSVTGDNRLEFEATNRISDNNPGSLRVYGRSYNILRVMSGFGGLAFYE